MAIRHESDILAIDNLRTPSPAIEFMYQSRILEEAEGFRSEIVYKHKKAPLPARPKYRYQQISGFFQILGAVGSVLVLL